MSTLKTAQIEELFWQLNKQAKENSNGSAKEQYDNLVALLSGLNIETVERLEEVELKYRTQYQNNPEYDLMHLSNGGFVQAGDDGFYMDFGSWLLSQGRELFDKFESEGHEAVELYIKQNHISPKDYLFESMCYAYAESIHILKQADSKDGQTTSVSSLTKLCKKRNMLQKFTCGTVFFGSIGMVTLLLLALSGNFIEFLNTIWLYSGSNPLDLATLRVYVIAAVVSIWFFLLLILTTVVCRTYVKLTERIECAQQILQQKCTAK